MARDLAWYVRRLRAMSPAEVAHRTYRAARHPFDVARMRAGLYARVPGALRSWCGPRTFYFDDSLARTPLSSSLRERADRLCAGEREVLGLGWITVDDPPWHVEPSRSGTWPRVDAARALASAPHGFDARLTWEMNRGHEWVILARAWAATREIRFLERLTAELSSWQQHNPLGIGINWASPMEAAIRVHSLCWVAGFLRGEPLGHVAAMIHTHATFVRRNLAAFSSANNHLLVELSGLAVAQRVLFGGPDSRALEQLDAEIDRQILSDGVNAEMATHYHIFVLEALLLVAHLEQRHGEPRARLERTIAKMAAYVAAIRCDDGSILHQGDNDDGKILPLLAEDHADQLLEGAASLFARDERASVHEGVFWITNGGSGRPTTQPARSRLFEASGQAVLRAPRLLATFDVGPFGFGELAAHAHCDALAVNVAIDGKPFLVERGTYRYNGDRENRDRFRATAAHNTVQGADREQAMPRGPFLWSSQPSVVLVSYEIDENTQWFDANVKDGSQRRLLQARGSLLGVDRAKGRVTTRFHLAPSLVPGAPIPLDGGTCFHCGSGWLWVDAEHVQHEPTPHSAIYGAKETAITIRGSHAEVVTWVLGTGDCAETLRLMHEQAAALGWLPRGRHSQGPAGPRRR